ncbi:paired small multidrug resistance pump [Cytobacillus horneckiae]|uniref:QacE family quaternary ammonium compound efflux SMR transporter n=1 Tax=Cytobacillus horneckiae TaxID=549687 RepID=A0A2N0ZGJ8_9BACI|nr:multidrug efflux SMR transporter [Cytobacillus horneckiae]NRG46123.1 multidrug efflux SMR transporter [Bacillus sp. CRN 9]MBN6888279.1 multidrug efflux SMR transporter [Cytobacillus horneckiae]MCM3177135.1 multidrug efflux SMR transporter [Cytobacillus horneckiae]MEC1154834.1 multidrug efflux SMR transporter [Cytobacillus horneckiae]MED2940328.1 multidrug efflux SMR transporter [Cytobacillus horneckiae]
MTKYWLYVLFAGVLEVVWVSGLKYSETPIEWIFTAAMVVLSFFVLIIATKHLPVGTVYAVFAGLGTAGTVLVEMLVFGEPFKPLKILLILVLLSGVIGLKLLSDSDEEKVEQGGAA